MSTQKNISTSFLYQIGITIINFATTIFITRLIGTLGRGQVAIYNNAVMIATAVCGVSMASALVYFIASKKLDKHQAFSIIIVASAVAILLMSVVCAFIFFGGWQSSITPFNTAGIVLILYIIQVVFTIFNINICAMLNANNEFIFPLQLQFFTSILFLFFLIIMHVFIFPKFQINTTFSILSFIVFYALQTVILLIFLLHKYQLSIFNISFSIHSFQQLMAFSAMAFACNITQLLCYRIDIWFLQYYHSASIVGVYSIATLCVQLLWILPNQFANVLYTKFNQHQNSVTISTLIANIVAIVFWICLLVFGMAFVLSILGIPLLFGNEFIQSIKILGILLIGAIPIASALIISTFNASINRLDINLKGSVIGLIFCIILNYLLIPKYGYYGAAIASVLAYISNCAYLYLIFCKMHRVKMIVLFWPNKQYLKNIKTHWHAL